MRPYQHARSSARGARPWQDDLALHEFMDSTKAACADRRHRVVLHHVDLGAEIARAVFPDRQDVDGLVRSHVTEDLGHAASLADWFEFCDPDALPRPAPHRIADGPDGLVRRIMPRLSAAAHPAAHAVCAFLFRPCAFLSYQPERALPLLMNAVGPLIVRRAFGPPVEAGDGAVVDHGWIAEAAIFTAFGRIPDLGEVVRCWWSEPKGSVREEDRS